MKGNAALATLVVLCPITFAQTATDSPAAVAAKARQEKLQSVDFTFRIQETVEPGAMQRERSRDGSAAVKFPAERLALDSTNRLLFDGNRIRHEDNHPLPDERSLRFEPNQGLSVTDGKLKKYFYHPKGDVSRQASVAKIANPRQDSVADFDVYMPLHMAARGYDNPGCRAAYTFKKLKPSGPGLVIGGVATEEFTLDAKSRNTTLRCWVSPVEGYSVRRVRLEWATGKAICITDVLSAKEAVSGQWLPTSWKETMFSDSGAVHRTFQVTVTKADVGGTHADSEFDLQFPPGVEVYDEPNGKYFVVRDDGTPRVLRGPGEDTYAIKEDLKSNWWSRNWWWLLSGAVVALGGLFFLARRVWKPRAASYPTPGPSPSGGGPTPKGDS